MSQSWRLAWFLFFAAALNYADRAALASVIPPLRTDLGATDADIGMIGSVFLWTYALASLFSGHVADRLSRSRIIFWSLLVWSLITVATGFATHAGQLYVLRTSLGVAESFYMPAAAALLAVFHPPATRGRAMGLHLTGFHAGAVFGGVVAGTLAEHLGWRWGFWLLGGAGVGLALLSPRFLADRPAGHPAAAAARPRVPPAEAYRYLARVPTFYVMLACTMIAGVASWTLAGWLPLYFRENYGLGLGSASFVGFGLNMAPALVGLSLSGWISDRGARLGARNRVLIKALSFVLSAPFLLAFLGAPSLAVVGTALALATFVRSLGSANEHPIICDLVPPPYRSTAIGILNTFGTAAGGVGVLAAGLFKQRFGLGAIFGVSAFLFAFAAGLLFLSFVFFAPGDLARAERFGAPAA